MSGIDDSVLAAAIGAEIYYWRKRSGMDRKRLSKLIRKSANTVGRYERGNTMPTISETWRICDALGVSVSEFVGRVDAVVRRSGIKVVAGEDGRFVVMLGDQILNIGPMVGAPDFPEREMFSEAERQRNADLDAQIRLAAKRGRVEPDDQ